jgi:hypothetical protein
MVVRRRSAVRIMRLIPAAVLLATAVVGCAGAGSTARNATAADPASGALASGTPAPKSQLSEPPSAAPTTTGSAPSASAVPTSRATHASAVTSAHAVASTTPPASKPSTAAAVVPAANVNTFRLALASISGNYRCYDISAIVYNTGPIPITTFNPHIVFGVTSPIGAGLSYVTAQSNQDLAVDIAPQAMVTKRFIACATWPDTGWVSAYGTVTVGSSASSATAKVTILATGQI